MLQVAYLRFRHRRVIEIGPLLNLLAREHQLRKRADQDEIRNSAQRRERYAKEWYANRLPSSPPAYGGSRTSYPRGTCDYYHSPGPFRFGWYGVERGQVVAVFDCISDGPWNVLELWADTGCRVLASAVEQLSLGDCPPEIVQLADAWETDILVEDPRHWSPKLTPLENVRLDSVRLDPARYLFRHPDEAAFWSRIVADLDSVTMAVYADWLEERDDPYAWVFRDAEPFWFHGKRIGWQDATGLLDCGRPDSRPTLWEFARMTNRHGNMPVLLADRTPVPQFIAYLLGAARIANDGKSARR